MALRVCKSSSCVLMAMTVLLLVSNAAMADVSCTTSADSPTQGDANVCVQYVRTEGSASCCQVESDEGCTTLCTSGTAAVDVCGSVGCTTCLEAGDALNTVLADCVVAIDGQVLVAGTNTIEDVNGITVRIRTSDAESAVRAFARNPVLRL